MIRGSEMAREAGLRRLSFALCLKNTGECNRVSRFRIIEDPTARIDNVDQLLNRANLKER